jgi:hypothetical protein
MQVAIGKATDASGSATIIATVSFVVLMGFWYAVPLLLRMRDAHGARRRQ